MSLKIIFKSNENIYSCLVSTQMSAHCIFYSLIDFDFTRICLHSFLKQKGVSNLSDALKRKDASLKAFQFVSINVSKIFNKIIDFKDLKLDLYS